MSVKLQIINQNVWIQILIKICHIFFHPYILFTHKLLMPLAFKDLYNYEKNGKSLENYKSYIEFLDI